MAVQTQTALSVYSGSVSGTPLQVARDYLEGWYGDYFFCRLDDDSYILIMAGEIDDNMYATDCSIVEINAIPNQIGFAGGYEIQSGYSSGIQISNPNHYLAYSSEPDYPKLVEGGENYGFATVVLLLVILFYNVFCSIYKHIGL
ncbi:MAG: hypothetical protein IJ060_04550 [Oscillospiraceae bacterium]|nr:hypothetical protein [Oscillospiraceae bacterium]